MNSTTSKPCEFASADPDLWFREDADGEAEAVEACLNCPAMLRCREYARTRRIPYGIFGAETPAERAEALGTTLAKLRGEGDIGMVADRNVKRHKPPAEDLGAEIIRDRLTLPQAGERYGVSYRTIERWLGGMRLLEPCEICGQMIKFNPIAGRPQGGVQAGILCPSCRRTYQGRRYQVYSENPWWAPEPKVEAA